MKKLIYALGDIHGDYEVFCQLLADFDPQQHQLVLMGDLLDRGAQSKECLLLGQELVEKHQAIYLKGNHEDLLVRFVADPVARFDNYMLNGGGETINSLLHPGAVLEYSAVELSAFLRRQYPELLAFLAERPLYYEWHDFVFAHAGVDLTLADWRQTQPLDFVWIREPFHQGQNQTGKTIVFGHTPTPDLYGDNVTTTLWQRDHKIGIDGGGIYGGSVHGVVFAPTGIVQDYEIHNLTGGWQPQF